MSDPAPLTPVSVSGIYGDDHLLPQRMSWLSSYALPSFSLLVSRCMASNLPLRFSEMFRTHEQQAKLYQLKPRLAVPSGQSYHEAGLAFDVDVAFLDSRSDTGYNQFVFIASYCGWRVSKIEPWHFYFPSALRIRSTKSAAPFASLLDAIETAQAYYSEVNQ